VNAHLGLADLARCDAEAGLAFADERADPWVAGWGFRVLGFLELSLGRLADASRYLSRVDDIAESIGLREPGQWRFHADHLEALIGLGELGRAGDLLARFEERACRNGRPWPLATSARSRALLLAAQQDTDGAAAAIGQALATTSASRCPSSSAGPCSPKGSCGGGPSRSGPPANRFRKPGRSSNGSALRCGRSGPRRSWPASASGPPHPWT
jgi:hypothetical protein